MLTASNLDLGERLFGCRSKDGPGSWNLRSNLTCICMTRGYTTHLGELAEKAVEVEVEARMEEKGGVGGDGESCAETAKWGGFS